MDRGGGAQTLDATWFPAPIPDPRFWTSSQLVGSNPLSAWIVVFDAGYSGTAEVTGAFAVRCVR